MRRIRWQEEELQSAWRRRHVVLDPLGFVDRMAVDDQKRRALGVLPQALEERQEDLGCGTTLVDHEPERPGGTHRQAPIQRKASAGGVNHRGLAHRRPRGAGRIVRADARLIREQKGGTDPFGFGGNGWEVFFLPALDPHRVALHRSVEWALGRETERRHDPAHRRARHAVTYAPLDQLTDQPQGPQRKLKPVLLWRLVTHRPRQLLAQARRRTPRNRLGLQRLLPAAGKGCQPAKHRADSHALGVGYTLRGLAIAHRFHRLMTHRLQGNVVVFSAAYRYT